MRRKVLVIPKEEIKRHFEKNSRKDIKIVAPSILTDKKFSELKVKGKDVKCERCLDGNIWRHSETSEPNNLCESSDFVDDCLPQYAQGPFAMSFANEEAEQDTHRHSQHLEIYFSSYPMYAEYRCSKESQNQSIKMEGGVIIFGPGVIHKMRLDGLTIIIEVPSVANDKERLCLT